MNNWIDCSESIVFLKTFCGERAIDVGDATKLFDEGVLLEALNADTVKKKNSFCQKYGSLLPINLEKDKQIIEDENGDDISLFVGRWFEEDGTETIYDLFNYVKFSYHVFDSAIKVKSSEEPVVNGRNMIVEINSFLEGINYRIKFNKEKGRYQLILYAPSLFSAMLLAVCRQITNSKIIRRCQNPTCGKYFETTASKTNIRYCCIECGAVVRKRRQRTRQKEIACKKEGTDE